MRVSMHLHSFTMHRDYPGDIGRSTAEFELLDSRFPLIRFQGTALGTWYDKSITSLIEIINSYAIKELITIPSFIDITFTDLNTLFTPANITLLIYKKLNEYKPFRRGQHLSVTLSIRALGLEVPEYEVQSRHFLYFCINDSSLPNTEFYSSLKSPTLRELNNSIEQLIKEYSITHLIVDTDIIEVMLVELHFLFPEDNITKLIHKNLSEYKSLINQLVN